MLQVTQYCGNGVCAIEEKRFLEGRIVAEGERFNRTMRNELLDQHLLLRLDDVREAVYWWMLEYNEERPHTSLGDLTPIEYAQAAKNSSFELSP